jgi:hypothetical protein
MRHAEALEFGMAGNADRLPLEICFGNQSLGLGWAACCEKIPISAEVYLPRRVAVFLGPCGVRVKPVGGSGREFIESSGRGVHPQVNETGRNKRHS